MRVIGRRGVCFSSASARALILLALEVIWFRFLRLYVVSSPTAFAIMLAVVLAGIGLGGLAAGAIFRSSRRSNQLLAVLLLLQRLRCFSHIYFFRAN